MTGEDTRYVFLLNRAQRRVQRWVEGHADNAVGIRAAQAGALFALLKQDGQLIGSLADALDIAPSAMTTLAARLATAGWVERRASKADGRASEVWLTAAGRAKAEDALEVLRPLNAALREGFSDEEMRIVSRWLQTVATDVALAPDDD